MLIGGWAVQAYNMWYGSIDIDLVMTSKVRNKLHQHVRSRGALGSLAPADVDLDTLRPTIEATFTDELSGILVEATTLVVDGEDVTDQADITDGTLTYTPREELSEGEHTIELTLEDRAGNQETYQASFDVSTGPPGLAFALILVALAVISGGAIHYYRSVRPEE